MSVDHSALRVSVSKARNRRSVVLTCALDPGRTPTAVRAVIERVGDLAGDLEVDDATLAAMAMENAMAPPGSLSDEIIRHLTPEIGPSRIAQGGDWLLRMPMASSVSRGLLPD